MSALFGITVEIAADDLAELIGAATVLAEIAEETADRKGSVSAKAARIREVIARVSELGELAVSE